MKSGTPDFFLFNLEEVDKVVNAGQNSSNNSKAKIQKVPAFCLRERPNLRKCYSPKLISIGPIHHGSDNVKAGTQYKLMWTAKYLSTNNNTSTFEQQRTLIIAKYKSIKAKIVEVIEGCYSDEVIQEYKYNDYDALAWILFVDGCSVLEFMKKASTDNPGEALQIKIDQLILIKQDLLLLENQIPFELLQLLCPNTTGLSDSLRNFLKLHHMSPKSARTPPPGVNPQPAHLLDCLRKEILGEDWKQEEKCVLVQCPKAEEEQTWPRHRNIQELKAEGNKNLGDGKKEDREPKCWPRHRNIQELKAAGIKVKKLDESNIRKISFSSYHHFFGRLSLPEVIVDDSTETTYLNLIAYEMCPDFKNDFSISSYVAFLDSLIDPNPEKYDRVKQDMEKHCNRHIKTWMAEFEYTHFQSPWSVLALLAAILVLGLTLVQTYFTIPWNHKPPL